MVGSQARRAAGQTGAAATWPSPMCPVNRFLGAIGIRPIEEHRASIGYWVAPAERGRGVATAAVRLLGRWALITLSLQRLELYHFVWIDASGWVAEKLGFQREGVLRAYVEVRGELRDCVMYSLLQRRTSRPRSIRVREAEVAEALRSAGSFELRVERLAVVGADGLILVFRYADRGSPSEAPLTKLAEQTDPAQPFGSYRYHSRSARL